MTTLHKERKALAEASTTLERRSQDASDKAYMCVAGALHAYAVDLLQPLTWSEATIAQACQQEHATRELPPSGDQYQSCGESPRSPSSPCGAGMVLTMNGAGYSSHPHTKADA